MHRVINSFRILVCAVLLGLVLLSTSQASAQSTTDTKLWAGFTGKTDLLSRLRLDVEHQHRFSSSNGIEKALTEFGLRLKVIDLIRLGVAYRIIATPDDGFWHRGDFNLGLAHSLGPIDLSYRLRLQSTRRSTETVSAVRNKFGLAYDTDTPITPSAAFELHYSTTDSEFREARFLAGADLKISKKIQLGAFYMFQSEFNKRVGENNHVLKLGLTYVFRRVKAKKKKKLLSEPAAVEAEAEPL